MDNRVIIIALLFFTSCGGQKVITESKTVRDSVVVREVEKEVLVPGYSLETPKINIDSLAKLLASGVKPEIINRTLIKNDPELLAQVKIVIDEYGNLMATCEKQDELLKFMMQERDNYRFEVERIVVEQRDNILKEIWKYVRNTLILLGIGIIGIVAFKILK